MMSTVDINMSFSYYVFRLRHSHQIEYKMIDLVIIRTARIKINIVKFDCFKFIFGVSKICIRYWLQFCDSWRRTLRDKFLSKIEWCYHLCLLEPFPLRIHTWFWYCVKVIGWYNTDHYLFTKLKSII